MKIIDCHVHLNHYEGAPFLTLEKRIRKLIDTMRNANVDQAIVLTSYIVNEDRPSTAKVIDATRKYDGMLELVAGLSIDNHTEQDF